MARRKSDDGLRALLRSNLPQVQWSSIETGLTQAGVPDLEGCSSGAQAWVECKSTDAWAVKFETEQVGWHARRAREGGRSFVLVRRRHGGGPRKGAAADELWVYAGKDAAALREHGLKLDPVEKFVGGPRRWNWSRVHLLLFPQESLMNPLAES